MLNKAAPVIPKERMEKAMRLRFEKERFLSLGAAYLLGLAMREYKVEDEEILKSEHGKPYLRSGAMHFSLSHSGCFALCAFGSEEVGADIEEIRCIRDSLITRVCTENEQTRLFSETELEKQDDFFRLWTCKESYMKFLGTGFSLPPEKIHLCLGENVELSPEHIGPEAYFREYHVPGYKLTVCSGKNDFPNSFCLIK